MIRIGDLVDLMRRAGMAAVTPQLGAELVLVGPPPKSGAEDDSQVNDWSFRTAIGSREALEAGVGPDFLAHEVIPLRKRSAFFPDTFMVGRAATSDVHIDDASISKLHARIRRDEKGELWITDNASTNGTRVRGELVARTTKVASGDAVQFGDRAFVLYQASSLERLLRAFGGTPSSGTRRP